MIHMDLFRRNCLLQRQKEMEIIVEGVETQETLEQFVNLKCDFIQGFYFSKPLPEQEFDLIVDTANLLL